MISPALRPFRSTTLSSPFSSLSRLHPPKFRFYSMPVAQSSHAERCLSILHSDRSAVERGIILVVGVANSNVVPDSRPALRCRGSIRVRLAGFAIGLLMLGAPLSGAAAPELLPSEATATTPQTSSDALRVKVAPAIDDASLIPGWIAARNPRLAEQVPMLEGHEQWIAVEIFGDTYDYRVTVTSMRDGAPVGPTLEPTRCECNSEKLLELVDERITEAVGRLKAVPVQAPTPEVDPTGSSDEGAVQPNPQPPEPKRPRISALGIAGIVTTSVGAVAVAGGVTMVVLPPQSRASDFSLENNWRPPGVVTLAIGGAALAAGVSMLVLDVIQCRKDDAPRRCERRSKGPKLEVGPSFDVSGGGITFWGRF